MAGCKFCQHLAFEYERLWTRHINEYDRQLLAPRGLRGDIDGDRYRASIRLPALQCIKTCKGKQRTPPVPHLEDHGKADLERSRSARLGNQV